MSERSPYADAPTPADGAGRREPLINAPGVVIGSALALLAAFFALRFLPGDLAALIEWMGSASPARFLRDMTVWQRAPAAITTLATHMLFHSSLMHVGLNCVWLLAFGTPVARRLGSHAAGVAAFLILMTTSGMAGALAFIAVHPNSSTILIGASGGVSGLLGALVRFAFARPTLGPARPDGLARLSDPPVLVWSAAVILLNVFAGVFGGALGLGAANIAWEAHVGGYLFGLLTFPVALRLAGVVYGR
jgi:membrane associated rhomboid family serine protease